MRVMRTVGGKAFQSTLSVRRATTPVGEPQYRPQFQSTLSVRRATYAALEHIVRRNISIHALREESDVVLGFG